MNSKERLIRAIEHGEPDRVPLGGLVFYDWSTPFLEKALLPYFGFDETDESMESEQKNERIDRVLEKLGIDFRKANVDPSEDFMKRATFDPRFHRPWGIEIAPETLVDEWGVTRILNTTKTASRIVDHPLKELDAFDNYVFPDPDAEERYSSVEQCVKRWGEDYAISAGFGIEYLFDHSWFLRGFNGIIRDLYTNPTSVEKLYDRMQKYYLSVAKRLAELGVTILGVADDIATQNGMMMSPDLWRRFIKPRLREVVDTVKKRGMYTCYHSDGMIQPIIPDLVEIGIDILNPIQPECMDVDGIKKKYGDKLALSGTISLQKTLSQGTPKDVKEEVILRIKTCGLGGGLILSPSNNATIDIPIENFLAIYESVKKYGRYPIVL